MEVLPHGGGSLSCHGNTEETDCSGNELEFTSKKPVFIFFW